MPCAAPTPTAPVVAASLLSLFVSTGRGTYDRYDTIRGAAMPTAIAGQLSGCHNEGRAAPSPPPTKKEEKKREADEWAWEGVVFQGRAGQGDLPLHRGGASSFPSPAPFFFFFFASLSCVVVPSRMGWGREEGKGPAPRGDALDRLHHDGGGING